MLADAEMLKNRSTIENLLDQLRADFEFTAEITEDEEHSAHSIRFMIKGEAGQVHISLDHTLLSSPDYRELVKLFSVIQELGGTPYRVRVQGKENSIEGSENPGLLVVF